MQNSTEDTQHNSNLDSKGLTKPRLLPISFDFVETLSKSELLKITLLKLIQNLKTSPVVHIVTLSVLTLIIFIFSFSLKSYLLLTDRISSLESGAPVRVYLTEDIRDSDINLLRSSFEKEEYVEKAQFKSKIEALNEFKIRLNEIASLLSGLEDMNPLPASYEVYFKQGKKTSQNYAKFIEKYSNTDGVDAIHYDKFLLAFFSSAFQKLNYIGLPVLILMILAVFFITWGAFYLLIAEKKSEVEVLKLIGATNRYIKAPYVTMSVLLGLLAGGAGVFLTEFVLSAFNNYQIYQATILDQVDTYAGGINLLKVTIDSNYGYGFYLCILITMLVVCFFSANSCLNRYLCRCK